MTDAVRCEACGFGDAEEELLLCGCCDRCLRPVLPCLPAGDWFCPSCASLSAKSASSKNKKAKQFRPVQTKIVDFFKIERSPASAETPERNKRKRKPVGVFVVSKKKRKLLPFNPNEDPARRLRQMTSLPTALMATGPSSPTSSPSCPAWPHGLPTMRLLKQEECSTAHGGEVAVAFLRRSERSHPKGRRARSKDTQLIHPSTIRKSC